MLQIFTNYQNSKMTDERNSWISQIVAEELGAEGSEDSTTVAEMLAARDEEVRFCSVSTTTTLTPS